MAIALSDIGQAEWTDYVNDMRAEEALFWEAEWTRQEAEEAAAAEANYQYEYLTIPALCEGLCPLFEAWQEKQTAIGEALADRDSVILAHYYR